MEISKCMGCMSEFRGYPCPDCGYAPAKQQEQGFSLAPETILGGKYLVGRVLGQGGFGITYIGWDIALERKVAIKEYYPSGQVSRVPGTRALIWSKSEQARSARQEGMQMFLKEARKMAKLEDIPGVVKVRELFQENETAYIVMDFVEGQTLKSILQKNGPIPWNQVKPIFLSAIRAMEKVHGAGLVHRDLSPDNLMICTDGNVRILDLGAAKDLNINSGASSMQVAKGGFSPLEQYTQRGGSGTWTDVYAMAATIYYTLTGKLPPNAVDRLEEDTIRWDYPGLLALPAPALEALKQAMIVPSKKRTQTMAELEKGLFAQEPKPEPPKPEPPKPEPPKPEPPKPEPTPKKPLLKWLIPAVAAVVLVAGIGLWAKVIKPANDYKAAQKLMDNGEYDKAAEAFEALGDYQDSAAKAQEANYQAAQALMDAGEFDRAAEAFTELGDYRDSPQKAEDAVHEKAYQKAQNLLDDGNYMQSMWAFSELAYKDSAQKAQSAKEAYWDSQHKSLAAGYEHTVGLRSDGTVVATGDNKYGRCNVSGWTDIVAVAAGGDHTVGLRSDGTLVATGDNDGCYVRGWSDIVAVAAGYGHIVGLRSDGTVVATGENRDGRCNVSSWPDIVAVAAGYYHTVGLHSDGTVVATKYRGEYDYGQCNVSGWTDIVAVSAGNRHTVGLRSDGTLVATGDNEDGQCNVSGWTDIVAVATGGFHTVGLRSDGTVVATGYNSDGRCDVSGWTDIVVVAAGSYHTIGLRSDGTVVATGGGHTVGLRSDGTEVATGYNSDGRCDVSGWKDIRIPK